jgi:hypothetical protein
LKCYNRKLVPASGVRMSCASPQAHRTGSKTHQRRPLSHRDSSLTDNSGSRHAFYPHVYVYQDCVRDAEASPTIRASHDVTIWRSCATTCGELQPRCSDCYLPYLFSSCFSLDTQFLFCVYTAFDSFSRILPTYKKSNDASQRHASQRSLAPRAEIPRSTSPSCKLHPRNSRASMGNTIRIAGREKTAISTGSGAIGHPAKKLGQPGFRGTEASREQILQRRDQADARNCFDYVVNTCHVRGSWCRDAEE